MHIKSIFLITLIPFIVLLLGFLLFFSFKLRKNSTQEKLIASLKEQLNPNRILKLDRDISKVEKISKNQYKFREFIDTLDEIHTKISEEIILAKKNLDIFVSTNSKDEKKDMLSKIKSQIAEIDSLESSFYENYLFVSKQDEFLRGEFASCSRNLREIINVYASKRVLLNDISGKIDFVLDEIKKTERFFEDALRRFDDNEAKRQLKIFSQQVMMFAKIIDSAPKTFIYLNRTIPELIKKLSKNYLEKKEELNHSLEHINFKKSILKLELEFHKAQNSFENLKMNNAIQGIKNILRGIKSLENMINYEVRSRNLLIARYKIANIDYQFASKAFNNLILQYRDIISSGKIATADLNETILETKRFWVKVEESKKQFDVSIGDKNIQYSAKVSRFLASLRSQDLFIERVNTCLEMIWILNTEKSIYINKFKQVEAVTNELLANIKKLNIILKQNEIEGLQNLNESLNKFSDKESHDFSKNKKEEIDSLIEMSVTVYKAVGGKIQVAEMASNFIKELSTERALDDKLNYVVVQAEQNYLEGKYAYALNLLITHLEDNNVSRNIN